MSDSITDQPRIAFHTLRIAEPAISLGFYQDKLGMTLYGQADSVVDEVEGQQYFLGFPSLQDKDDHDNILSHPNTLLELIHRPDHSASKHTDSAAGKAGYWKIGITLADVGLAREYLIDSGTIVSEPEQFLDIGYLCHLKDPDGYSIELLQHLFAENHQPCPPQPHYKLGSVPTFGQITLRVKDPDKSLKFYASGLGMSLLSRQIVEPYRFTLYFLAYTEEQPPFPDLDDVRNREWLWQRPYTLLELQHVWGTEDGQFSYRTTPDVGFERLSIASTDISAVIEKMIANGLPADPRHQVDACLGSKTALVHDPDGYAVRIIESA